MSKTDKKQLIITSGILGICVLLFYYAGELFGNIISKFPIIKTYYALYPSIIYIVQILYSFLCIVVPFAIGAIVLNRINKKNNQNIELLPLNKPASAKGFFLALGVGFFTMEISNYLTTFFVFAAESNGFIFDSGESPTVNGLDEYFWQVLATAVFPALIEEFAVRGIVMQSLRKYGDLFAVSISAVIFGLMHGNLVQAPFAFILGFIMGWAVIVTKSMWTGIAIHFMNNFYATTLMAISDNFSEEVYIPLFLIVNGIGFIIGIACIIRIMNRYRDRIRLQEPGGNTLSAKRVYRAEAFLYALISIPMFVALVVMIVEISKNVHYIG